MVSKFTDKVYKEFVDLILSGDESIRVWVFRGALEELERDISAHVMSESQNLANKMANIRVLEE